MRVPRRGDGLVKVLAALGLLSFAVGLVLHAVAWEAGHAVVPTTGATQLVILSGGHSVVLLAQPLYAVYRYAMPLGSIVVFLVWPMQAFVDYFMKEKKPRSHAPE
jgi:hypothetical protein